jgi:lipoyl(octanoyl) transferase
MDGGPATWEVAAGLTDYQAAVAAMAAQVQAIRAGTAPEKIWLVEHPPLYTAGTSARDEDLREPGRFATHRTGRGGQWTYHGPGQRVIYAMLDLTQAHGKVPARDVRAYVAGLEAWMIGTLAAFGVKGETRAGRVGIWVATAAGDQKIGAIGVRVTRWVSWHGAALNIAPDLAHFGGIVPCGIAEHGVTSLAALGVHTEMAAVDEILAQQFRHVFG